MSTLPQLVNALKRVDDRRYTTIETYAKRLREAVPYLSWQIRCRRCVSHHRKRCKFADWLERERNSDSCA